MRSTATLNQPQFEPLAPRSVEETGLSRWFVLDLVLKHAFFEGIATLNTLARRSKLAPQIIHSLFRTMQKEQLCETRGMVEEDYEINLTAKGRAMADVALKKSHYVGPAPVPLVDYNRGVALQALSLDITRQSIQSALADLVLPDSVIRQLGAALATGGSILLHGSTGNGKTSIAERLHHLLRGFVFIPRAVEVSGQVVSVYDPFIHVAVEDSRDNADERWVRCQRPMIKAGGELRVEMLEPRIDETTRVYVAPVQMKSNNGILLIDDFGRQHLSPRELLNRWIVPLDRHTDILTLHSGASFEIPFQMLVIFATNLALSDLAEDAFMRRLKNKIRIDPLNPDLFRELWRRVCRDKNLPCTTEMENYLCDRCSQESVQGLRACFPRDIVTILNGIAVFNERSPEIAKDLIDQALEIYFGRQGS